MASHSYYKNKEKTYYHHDDRSGGNFNRRHVSFKSGPGMKGRRGWNMNVRRLIEEGDIDMGSNATMKYNNKPIDGRIQIHRNTAQRTRGPKLGISKFDRKLPESSSSWYKVTISHGKKYNRQEIIKTLQSFIQPIPLLPIYVQLEDDDMTFFVDNHKVAQRISDANLKLQMRDGWKIQIKVEARMPYVEPNTELTQKIKQVMSNKYDARTCCLDLSRFHANQEFLENDLFVPLNRQVMLLCVFQIIAESVPNIQSLNLSDNKIFTTEHFSMLKRHACNLKSLDLSKNKIKDLNDLNCLQGVDLENLILDDNPLCDKYHDQTSYVR